MSEDKKEILTEVTSIAQEEARTGQTIDVPTGDELVQKNAAELISNIKRLNQIIQKKNGAQYSVSRKGMNRILNAIMALPTSEIPVLLQGDDEKLAFALGQKIINNRFVIIQDHIIKEIKKAQEAKGEKDGQ